MNILVHGFNTKNPQNSIGKLAKFINTVELFNYGWFWLFSVMLFNKREAKRLKSEYGNGHIVWAHSNGNAISVEAARQGMEIETLVCINPALRVDLEFPDTIKNIIVVYSKHDKATWSARMLEKIPLVGCFVPNAWGAMGTYGAKDPRVINIDMSDIIKHHSGAFDDDVKALFVKRINEKIKGL